MIATCRQGSSLLSLRLLGGDPPKPPQALLLLLLLACGERSDPRCDPRLLAAGEVRARRVPCGDELIEGGEGRRSDWLIENAVARYVIRDSAAALTQLEGAGGTIVDAAAPGGTDTLVELV